MKKYSWGPEGGAPTIEEIPDSEKEKALEMHYLKVNYWLLYHTCIYYYIAYRMVVAPYITGTMSKCTNSR